MATKTYKPADNNHERDIPPPDIRIGSKIGDCFYDDNPEEEDHINDCLWKHDVPRPYGSRE